MRLLILILCTTVAFVYAPPPRREENSPPASPPGGNPSKASGTDEADLNLPYQRYLMEVVKELEGDAEFQKKMQALPEADLKEGKIADHLDELGVDIRSRLHDIKVREVERLRQVIQAEVEKDGDNVDIDKHIGHLETDDIDKFNAEDLRKLIKKTVADLDSNDVKRKEEFKEYEMKKEAMREHKLAQMEEADRKKAIEEHEKNESRHRQHEKIQHPGGKEQLEEVWEEGDGMAGNDFDPTTFFHLHDLDGNGYWDELELEALFIRELDKIYNSSNPEEDDPREREEEMNRMREHVMNEMDKDGNKMISMHEFIQDTQGDAQDTKEDEGWKGIDDEEPVYTPEELAAFEAAFAQQQNWGDEAYGTTAHTPQQMPQVHQAPPQVPQHHEPAPVHHEPQAQAQHEPVHAQVPVVQQAVPAEERKPDATYGV